jgi:hypothetical protein
MNNGKTGTFGRIAFLSSSNSMIVVTFGGFHQSTSNRYEISSSRLYNINAYALYLYGLFSESRHLGIKAHRAEMVIE